MTSQTSSPREAEVAARLLARLPAVLERDEVLSLPDERANVGTREVYDERLRAWVVVDADEVL